MTIGFSLKVTFFSQKVTKKSKSTGNLENSSIEGPHFPYRLGLGQKSLFLGQKVTKKSNDLLGNLIKYNDFL